VVVIQPTYDVAVIGGGFFGCMIALRLRGSYARVVVLEANDRLLGRASYHNQARVHNGYHYPRSTLTAVRSRVNFPRFVADFSDCIDASFDKYYAVARTFSKVSARQFRQFFERVGAPIALAPERISRLFDPQLIEEVFSVQEYAFNAATLAERLTNLLADAGVEIRLGTEVQSIKRQSLGEIGLCCTTAERTSEVSALQVFNCTYSRMNHVLTNSGMPPIPLKHELTELALVQVPEALQGLGITVMCGPFFSVMPFPPRGLHTLSHVRYTPHEAWTEPSANSSDPYGRLAGAHLRSNFPFMMRDAARYLPIIAGSVLVDSLWEIKTVLPASETDDSRPILMRKHHGIPNLHCVLGAKIDNVYDALEEIDLISRARKAG
jgi:glycine/D-amino acid oxidase-like deaminating enzyme